MIEEVVPPALEGERVDRVVAMVTGLPRAEVAALVEGGRVYLRGRPVTSRSRRVVAGDALAVDVPEREPVSLEPDAEVSFAVVHEDQHVIVVDKPAGLVVHPGAGNAGGTLVNGLVARYPELATLPEAGAGAPERPGIVHRLDAGTSGLLAVARTPEAYHRLVEMLSRREVDRRYHALVLGSVEAAAGVVDAPIGRSENDPTRMAVATSGREARTRYEVRRRFRDPMAATELTCRLETGRTHQIRVHLAAIGHPVAGDHRYGGDRPALPLHRPFLHAEHLAFEHPVTAAPLAFQAQLPPDLVTVLEAMA